MENSILQYTLYILITIVLAIPLGAYIGSVMLPEGNVVTRCMRPIETGMYRMIGVDASSEMNWKQYAMAIGWVSLVSFLVLWILLMVQGALPLNPQHVASMSWDLAANTAISYITNTNWQSYAGEAQLSYLSQMLGLTVQNFISAGVGISVLFALLRGFVRATQETIGNFWSDFVRILLYVLLPLSMLISLLLVSQGVVQNLNAYQTGSLLESQVLEDGTRIEEQILFQGPAATQIAIKQLGTNGGGFFGTNSAFPLENPTIFSNLIQMIAILLLPMSLCFAFGKIIKDSKQGIAIFSAMLLVLLLALSVAAFAETHATPLLSQNSSLDFSGVNQSLGNMEGKEARFGIASSVTWSIFTTAASNGSVNSMLNSYAPLSGFTLLVLMQLGEVIFGGAGSGLYGMIAFAILTVFIAGLMVGRTPEYLGKKIEPYEMKMTAYACLATPVAILVTSGIAAFLPSISTLFVNEGAHKFSEFLYMFTSAGANNGSAFAGVQADTLFLNTLLGISMIFARFVPMVAMLAVAGSLAKKKKVASSSGTLSTCNPMFVFLLVFVIVLIGALSFFPALSLGPIAEYLNMIV